MADIECPRCGHRALSVATRCPRCGHEFSEELLRHRPPMPGRRPFRPGPAIAAVLVIIAVAALLARGDRDEDDAAATPGAAEAAETLSAEAGADAPLPADTAPRPASRPAPRTTPPAPVPTPPVASPTAAGTLRRWATEWVNLRGSRSGRAGVVRVLRPGEPLEVDSLVRGWYRVVADGQTQGYVHRRFLRTAP